METPLDAKENVPLERKASQVEDEPAAKRRRVDGKASNAQPSFVETLERLNNEYGSGAMEDTRWGRPSLTPLNPKTDAIIFQQTDIEEIQSGSALELRLYGVTEAGHSVLAHVTNFLPYFYIPTPRGFADGDMDSFKATLNNQVQPNSVHSVKTVKKRSLWGYRGEDMVLFLKITRGECDFRDLFPEPITTYESNIAYTLRFMVDRQVIGMNWIEVPANKYALRTTKGKTSSCQIEFDVRYDQFISHAAEGEWSKMAPLRILSFDIECAGRKGIFPEADKDPVIQIANMVTRQGESAPFVRNIFTLEDCAHIVGSQVLSFDDEADMLVAWRDFIAEVDPDVVIGYNIANFDLPYLMDRAKALKATKFPFLGRMHGVRTQIKDTHFSSKAYGQRDSKETQLDGRLQLDMLQVMQRDYKLRSYSLNAVCAQFLGEQKEDVHHSVITELQNGGPESRRRLAIYCLKDAYLPQRLMDKLMCFINYTEMARVTGVPFNYLLSKGQQIKVISQLFRKANAENYVVPAMKGEGSDEQYEGATVIEPSRGYYDTPIATLDFSSLYPSIMMAHNLCYTTLLDKSAIDRLHLVENEDYIRTPNHDFFATSKRRKGLLPTILEDLISARKRAKADLKKETDPFKRAVLDGRQLALKISANSVYGFTGATIGKLPCLAISSSVTAYGREMIELTKSKVEAEYSIENGREWDAKVIYGDTDSVMVNFGCQDLATAMALGSEAAAFVTGSFKAPIKLEFEKVYFPYLLISKKRYAGLYWTKPEKWDKMDTKGIETVRRDNCRLVSTVIETCLHKMLIERDKEGAIEYVKSTIAQLLQGQVDMSQLVITKALSKLDYATKQAHTELAERMKKRDPGSAPAVGDRVAYVIVQGTKNAAAYEKSEDPLFVLENNIPIDTKYYLDNQLSNPLLRIFEPIMGTNCNNLLQGDHTRTVKKGTPNIGGLMKFVVKSATCLGCKTELKGKRQDSAVCINCKPKIGALYQDQINKTSELQVAFARLWTQCQRCQGSLHQDVLCTSKDCPIFYRRKKAQKDVGDAALVLERFSATEW
ncbi:DNA-directed DNA polymerase delta [Tulasnella sp. 331]|nr:DNA-directed DNA polymerase delta [Tulasnella sp. 331]KAG8888130.1 DNA-directed DNA polymerase delta [Tulasnella sp. 332]